jgi:pimeloyl-ACP methyl ester carboxylesterase
MTTPAQSSRYLDVDGGHVFADVRTGSGPTVVFLHYWGGTRRTWRPVIDHLAPSQAVVAADDRGWGKSAETPGPYSLTQLADDTERIIDQLDCTDYVLVGHSMGGKLAQLIGSRRPSGLKGLVLVAPSPPAPVGITPERQQQMAHAYENADTINESIDEMLTANGLSDALRRQVHEDSSSAQEEARLFWPLYGVVDDISGEVAKIDVPVLVLAGSHDKVDPPQFLHDHLLTLLPKASFEILTGTGHLSPLEVPDQIAERITRFLATIHPAHPDAPAR